MHGLEQGLGIQTFFGLNHWISSSKRLWYDTIHQNFRPKIHSTGIRHEYIVLFSNSFIDLNFDGTTTDQRRCKIILDAIALWFHEERGSPPNSLWFWLIEARLALENYFNYLLSSLQSNSTNSSLVDSIFSRQKDEPKERWNYEAYLVLRTSFWQI